MVWKMRCLRTATKEPIMDVTRGTTEGITIDIPEEIDLNEAQEVWVSFTQNSVVVVDKKLSDESLEIQIDEESQMLYFTLSQEDTLKFKSYLHLWVGIRILLKDGQAFASEPEEFAIYDVNKGGVIE